MYLYIYDSFLNHKKYSALLARIENRLADLEIKGKINRLNILKNMKEVIEDGIEQGVKTVVAVGDDQTFSKVVNIIADLDVTLGLIPVNKKSKIARILGIPAEEQACDVLAQRLIKKIDLGKINQHYFIDSATIESPDVTLEFGKYRISPIVKKSLISICNLGFLSGNQTVYQNNISNPTDGLLEAVVAQTTGKLFNKVQKSARQSIFPFKKIKIGSAGEPATITIDQQAVSKTPVEISIAPNKLNIIVGNKRLF
ncbi:MAG: hypothetical protein UV78_C0005G0016 [Parcubacteria group bacterium GW2011_GWA2_43_17]|nr:MAG: hypothetical protein UV78_C0005G0016 [Parcubacteria group bacterium GW2011_GWA2_43_17]KKT90272.1 MAG: hypothetical protein UW91_C0061G0006 [Parcubacteria group bacterium GW2011_GWF2_45_11]KKT98023.1 MAG: hypothetical protein UW98_C0011G0004 [Parcubacteria group bacterium GW2011_GWC2_45_15]OGY92739.1 MAG: hypothetical protein A2260_00115 [Candidatus Komeilibacteria bacterium RIFOXYA2_FULL_45_9]OGY94420.1 MAG: hypothetical protein A3J95_01960 [Candidatus Komeilibacteria bacterium RIFOXYC2